MKNERWWLIFDGGGLMEREDGEKRHVRLFNPVGFYGDGEERRFDFLSQAQEVVRCTK